MATIHLILQGKGGVGKSLTASILTQYLRLNYELVGAIDTDPVNATFAGYKEFEAVQLDIMNGGDDVDPRQFDKLIEKILELPEDAQLVVDNGAATFLPFCSYLAQNEALALLKDAGHVIKLHTIVTGGQAIWDTLNGLDSLLKSFPNVPVIAWLNPYFGPIANGDGQPFTEFRVFTENKKSFEAVIRIPLRDTKTFGRDLEQLLADRLTFEQAQSLDRYSVMVRQRLKMLWRDVLTELDKAHL